MIICISLRKYNNSTDIILNYFVILFIIFTFHIIFEKTIYFFETQDLEIHDTWSILDILLFYIVFL